MHPQVRSFYDPVSSTFTHLVYDYDGGHAAVIDPVLDYDPASARTWTTSADQVLAFVAAHSLNVEWVLETHAHADHLTAAAYLKHRTAAKVAIGLGITRVQQRCKALFGLEPEFATDGSQFDRLFADGDTFHIGELQATVMATPGHTEDSLTYRIGDAAFVGDTVFAPATGTARADFPGGDPRALYRSIRAVCGLPGHTRLFLCHDYPSGADHPHAQSSPGEQQCNVHLVGSIDEHDFATMRAERDATLATPRLLLPALQVNIRAGELPPSEANGIRYLRLPLNQWGST